MEMEDLKYADPKFWDYKAEGNDSMILAYVGPKDPVYTEKALRLFKEQKPEFKKKGSPAASNNVDRVTLHHSYIENFIKPYLPEVDAGIPLKITRNFISAIASKVEPKRPERRRRETALSLVSTVGMLHPDHILPDSFTVEFKPKCGFLPENPLLPPDSIKRRVSRFQLLQKLKLKNGEVSALSKFEPSDIFSGNPSVIRKALGDLVLQPQGNLKVFRNGVPSSLTATEIESIPGVIASLSCLPNLLKLQRLDLWDVEFMLPIVKKAKVPTWESLVSDRAVVDGVKRLIDSGFRLPKTPEECNALINRMDEATARVYVAGFLISQASKDCSVMMTFKGGSSKPDVSIIDIDLKFAQMIESHYMKQDREIIENFMASSGK